MQERRGRGRERSKRRKEKREEAEDGRWEAAGRLGHTALPSRGWGSAAARPVGTPHPACACLNEEPRKNPRSPWTSQLCAGEAGSSQPLPRAPGDPLGSLMCRMSGSVVPSQGKLWAEIRALWGLLVESSLRQRDWRGHHTELQRQPL